MEKENVDLLVSGGLVVTMDAERRMIRDGAVAIERDRIAMVGKNDEVSARFDARRVVDARGKLVIPGLIDGHNHPVHFLSKGISDDLPTHLRWRTRVYPFERAASADSTYAGALATFAAMLRSGTTCFNDPGGHHVDSVARAAVDAGIRGVIARSAQDFSSEVLPIPPSARETTQQALEAAEELHARWDGAGDGRLSVWFALRSVYNSSDELCVAVRDLALRHGAGVHCHLCVTEQENQLSEKQWGVRSMERFRRLGLLGPNLYLVHMGAVNDEEVGWLAEDDVKVSHCPSASMLGGFGCIAHGRFPEMLDAGVTVSLGTDAGAVSRFLDMVRVMYLAAAAHKDAKADPTVIGCYKAFEMATIEGARALGMESEIGSLEAGKKADVVVMDAQGPDWHPNPLANPIADLVYAAEGNSTRTVIVDGRVVLDDRAFTTIDEAEVWSRCDAAATETLQAAGIDLRPLWPVV